MKVTSLHKTVITMKKDYKMDDIEKGRVLIFNQKTFYKGRHKVRDGTENDRDRLKMIMINMGFRVEIFNDLTGDQMQKKIDYFSRFDYNKTGCLIIFIMSHGDEDTIASFDREIRIENFIEPFKDENCPSLRGKPRIIVINSCRGNRVNIKNLSFNNNTQQNNARNELKKCPNNCKPIENIPADFLIVRSTMTDCVSYRDPNTGAWFVQELCNEISKESSHKKEINSILNDVCNALSKYQKYQHPCMQSSFTKHFFFPKKRESRVFRTLWMSLKRLYLPNFNFNFLPVFNL